jgi:endo-1,4-beta-xylanase
MTAGELDLLKRNFSSITAENLMKPKYLQPAEGRFEFGAADAFVKFAETHRLEVHGPTLVWPNQSPDWLFKDGNQPATRERVLERVNQHVSTIVGRYKGRIKSWDVANEAIDNDTSDIDLRRSPWFLATGGDYIAEAFRTAKLSEPCRSRPADPAVLLRRPPVGPQRERPESFVEPVDLEPDPRRRRRLMGAGERDGAPR